MESFFQFFKQLFNGNNFMPHGHCYLWRPEIVWLHVISDGLITVSYYAIPIILLFFLVKRKDFPFPSVLVMFGAFILLCGTTHLMAIVTLWDPVYRLDGIIKAATAVVSFITAIALIPLIPMALALRSPKELEAANVKLANANEKLKEIDQLKDNFFSNISHELRTPLTLILSPLESILANDYGPLSDLQRKYLETMHTNSIRLFQMVNSILDFAKLSSKKVKVLREPVDIVVLTNSITQEFEHILKEKQIQITFHCPVEKKIVDLDRYLYERILFNLLSNATKFTPNQGAIFVSLHFNEDAVRLTVRDTGIGISPSDQEKLFQRFQQVESAATRRFEGTGLGLALVKEFSLLLGGDVSVESELGKGSSFSVEIPAPMSHSGVDVPNKPRVGHFQIFNSVPAQELTSSKKTVNTQEGSKILIAEDNQELAVYISSLLNEFSETKCAHDGDEALELIQSWKPDLVILDVMMPKKDGISLCRQIKSSPNTANTGVILLTALTHRDALMRGWEAGADEYLFKPFHPKELVTRIKIILTQTQNNNLISTLNQKLITTARLAGMSEVATSILHNIGNILNSAMVSTALIMKWVSQSRINTLLSLSQTVKEHTSKQDDYLTKDELGKMVPDYLMALSDNLIKEYEDISHEIKNIHIHLDHLKDIVSMQKDISGISGIKERIVLTETVDLAVQMCSFSSDALHNIEIIKQYNYHETILVEKAKLLQILINLLRNAKDAVLSLEQEVPKKIIICLNKLAHSPFIQITIKDNGVGIDPSSLNKIFSLGYTTKPEGHGFGLHSSAIAAAELGGTLKAVSEGRNKGAIFILELPLSE